MISLILPTYGGTPNIERTIASVKGICDEVVIISTAIFDEDKASIRGLAEKVVELHWNYVFHCGFGDLHNRGTKRAKNDWLILLGTSETIGEVYSENIHKRLRGSAANAVFSCDHHNEPHQWKRGWNRLGGTHWSGVIHEEITQGSWGGLLFRMQDTEKVQDPDPIRREAFRFLKACAYNWNYMRLLLNPSLLGAANAGWLDYVRIHHAEINAFCESHKDMIAACLGGDRPAFLAEVERRVALGQVAGGVSFDPQGA